MSQIVVPWALWGDDQNIDVYLVEDNFCYGLASLGLSIGDEGAKYEAKSQMGGSMGTH